MYVRERSTCVRKKGGWEAQGRGGVGSRRKRVGLSTIRLALEAHYPHLQ